MTVNDPERRNSPYFAFFHRIRQIFRPISLFTEVEDRQKFPCIAVISTKVVGGIFIWFTWYIVRKILYPSSSLYFWRKL